MQVSLLCRDCLTHLQLLQVALVLQLDFLHLSLRANLSHGHCWVGWWACGSRLLLHFFDLLDLFLWLEHFGRVDVLGLQGFLKQLLCVKVHAVDWISSSGKQVQERLVLDVTDHQGA